MNDFNPAASNSRPRSLYLTELEKCDVDDDESSGKTLIESFTSIISLDKEDVESLAQVESRSSKKVSFGHVQIREYERTICYNPACTAGPAIGIGWNVVSQQTIDTDVHLQSKPRKRGRDEFRLGPLEREELLNDLGFDEFDVLASAREIRRVQKNREKSLRSSDERTERPWKAVLTPVRSLFARNRGDSIKKLVVVD